MEAVVITTATVIETETGIETVETANGIGIAIAIAPAHVIGTERATTKTTTKRSHLAHETAVSVTAIETETTIVIMTAIMTETEVTEETVTVIVTESVRENAIAILSHVRQAVVPAVCLSHDQRHTIHALPSVLSGDDEQGNPSGDEGRSDEEFSKNGRRDTPAVVRPLNGSSNGQISKEWHDRHEKLQQELQVARDNEQKAQDSLSKLQLLSKSQTAILKTTMIKKIQERDDQLDEMTNVIKDLEGKLQQAGLTFEAYSPPSAKASTSPNGASSEADAIAEISAMKAEMDRLMDENKALKAKATTSSAPLPSTATPPSSGDNTGSISKAKYDTLETEKQQLEKQLKTLQQQVATLKKEVASASSSAAAPPTAPPAAPETASSNTEELRTLKKKLTDATEAHKTAQAKIQKLEAELASMSSNHEASSSLATKATADSSKVESELQEQIQQLEKQIAELTEKLDQQMKAAQAKETALEERYTKLKTTAETELTKIKEQAKKAILDLKKKLESSSKSQEHKRKALTTLKAQVQKQKSAFAQLKTQIQTQNQQVPLLAKQLTDKITQRIQRQTDAMAGVVENYKREIKERKRLFNLVQELKGNIRVLCRVRPISKGEISNGSKAVCKFTPEEITVTGEKGKVKTWEFDHVFDTNSSQEELFAEVRPLVTSILDGYSVCIFAYGQTGSGKTFTMSGPAENPGINTRALQELFQRKVERSKEVQDEITVSIMEIYNEQIRDLLAADAANTNLQVRQGPTGNFVPGLTTIPVQTLDEVFDLIKRGNKNRSTHATDMNEHSSRSHSILSIQLKSTNIVTGTVANGKLFLVDLAGSERLSKTGAEGQRLKEAQNINKSLSALGDVIAARASKQKHVPYRNSSLTYLLQDALGGDSKTLMVACASPVDYNSEETFCTLNFAARARSVEMGKATKNVTQGASKE
ncbi:hypothetical protein Poli38472_009678 [Pythium oligandrum]|uniref:Kinesin-like protein n=1 Tax=Pythium oligandrum TaxID=41045 RepID=A0A8K1CFC8_PYTOL|nr:hypothetical protein Poli38472_009678 [Pythium oligandrum]|eukprot:TMW62185.1 hypothetical protein Poli38472_009678 [Pythium oligandrum]